MKYKKNKRTETVQRYEIGLVCDICKREFARYRGWDKSHAIVSCVVGNCFPEVDSSSTYEIDCCPACFMEKVKPLLEEKLGVVFPERQTTESVIGESKEG